MRASRTARVFLVVELCFIVGLAVGLIAVAVSYAKLSGHIQHAQYTACVADNETRHKTIGIVNEITGLPSSVKSGLRDPVLLARRNAALAKLRHDTQVNFGRTANCGTP